MKKYLFVRFNIWHLEYFDIGLLDFNIKIVELNRAYWIDWAVVRVVLHIDVLSGFDEKENEGS
jgi:hypothetical protein